MTIVTHNGTFHPDDVFAVASLFIRFGEMDVLRTRDEKFFSKADFLVDVGGIYDPQTKRFDHHQKGGAGKRVDGIPYASFGLVWQKFGVDICNNSRRLFDIIDKKLVSYIDAMDNGAGALQPVLADAFPYTIGHAIMSFNPTWRHKERDIQDKKFFEAVDFAKGILFREIECGLDDILGMEEVERVYMKSSDKKIIILEEDYPWEFVLSKYKEPLFVITPNTVNNTWELSAVRDNFYSFKNRKDLPKEWGGKRDRELIEVTKVNDAIFCHNALFFAVAKSREGAISLAEKALAYQSN
jgi:uncharacterized UPF0160 family protein